MYILLISIILSVYAVSPSQAMGSEELCLPWGKDSSFVGQYIEKSCKMSRKYTESDQNQKNLQRDSFFSWCSIPFFLLIRFHQRIISPTDGPRSHFVPTSSQYMYQSIEKYGIFPGVFLGFDRLLRENNDLWIYPLIQREKRGSVSPSEVIWVKYDPIS